MTSTTFSTLMMNPIHALHRLKDAGFTQEQAEAQVEIISECTRNIEETVATKKDLKELELATKRDIKELETATKKDIKELELRLTIKTGVIVSSIVGFFYILGKFF